MAELAFRNTDGRTYTYSDQNELYKALNKAGRSDFSWFHFSGGDNRVAMLPGEGEGMNVVSDGSSFHLAKVSSITNLCAFAGKCDDSVTYSSAIEVSENSVKRLVTNVLPLQRTGRTGSVFPVFVYERTSSFSVSEMQYDNIGYSGYIRVPLRSTGTTGEGAYNFSPHLTSIEGGNQIGLGVNGNNVVIDIGRENLGACPVVSGLFSSLTFT